MANKRIYIVPAEPVKASGGGANAQVTHGKHYLVRATSPSAARNHVVGKYYVGDAKAATAEDMAKHRDVGVEDAKDE